jgi:archaeal flagellar protein FlaJ
MSAGDAFSTLSDQPGTLYRVHAPTVKSDRTEQRSIRLKKGAQPDYAKLTPLQAMAWNHFKDQARAKPDPILEEVLPKAHMRIRADEYVAYTMFLQWFIFLPVGVAATVVLSLLFYLVNSSLTWLGVLLGVIIAVVMVLFLPLLVKGLPSSAAKARAKKIDAKLSPSMSFVSAMASADVNIDMIFRELAKQKIYGEVADEAAWITRDTELLGVDILSAIKTGASRSPSKRFQDFLQGVVTTATSGGQLKPYFLTKAEQYQREEKLEVLKRVESMGLLAEVFVTTIVAFPLFLVIMLSIFAIVGGAGGSVLTFLWAIVGIMIPLGQAAFIFIMWSAANEGK